VDCLSRNPPHAGFLWFRDLARISHQISAAAADPGISTALRSVGFLDVLSSTPAESSRRTPCIHARLRRLATKPGEKCGLGWSWGACERDKAVWFYRKAQEIDPRLSSAIDALKNLEIKK
jgi:hypothetical protein